MQITILGTSSMVPTKVRNHSAVLLRHNTEGILFDCGEGTQRQIKMAGIRPTAITRILISHWHGDHVLGLPGLIQTLGGSEYSGTLNIYGPKGTEQRINKMYEAFVFDDPLEMKIHDIKPGKFLDTKEFYIEAYKLEHTTPCLGFRFVEKDRRRINLKVTKELQIPEGPLLGKLQNGQSITWKGKKIYPTDATYKVKGKVFSYVVDTIPCDGAYKASIDSDFLICEATYTSQLTEKAGEYGHMTAAQAAQLANQAGAKKLVLTHFSQRYKDTLEIVEDARVYFDDVTAAEDLMKFKL